MTTQDERHQTRERSGNNRKRNTAAQKQFRDAIKKYRALQLVHGLAKNDPKGSRDASRWLEATMKTLIQDYASAECQQLADNIYHTLPRELRDTIYKHYWAGKPDKETFYGVRYQKLGDTPWMHSCDREPCQCFCLDELPHITQHQIVGLEMAREVAIAYYKAMPDDRLGYDITSLATFLTKDHFHLGIVPADHIRRLHITISPVKCPKLVMHAHGEYCISLEGQQLVKKSMGSLAKIQQKDGFQLCITLGDGIWASRPEQTMEALRPVYKNLKQAGMRIHVYGRPSTKSCPIARIDGYYGMARQE
ncbi:hypothetical protein FB567DRAFT_527503 [Paraphoma chrysanthemicola]|uniref:Uncharacterized protein n=1 Tax=Paraphoma chrysanthemicola TaxID=798071 RepID=A0A8K0R471_9PLEO|nr:hypothetical protein FB567DRAFT_527503 [Paraphoma chrysanthemicola]